MRSIIDERLSEIDSYYGNLDVNLIILLIVELAIYCRIVTFYSSTFNNDYNFSLRFVVNRPEFYEFENGIDTYPCLSVASWELCTCTYITCFLYRPLYVCVCIPLLLFPLYDLRIHPQTRDASLLFSLGGVYLISFILLKIMASYRFLCHAIFSTITLSKITRFRKQNDLQWIRSFLSFSLFIFLFILSFFICFLIIFFLFSFF